MGRRISRGQAPCGECSGCKTTSKCGKCTACTDLRQKQKCRAKRCQKPVTVSEARSQENKKTGAVQFDPSGDFTEVMTRVGLGWVTSKVTKDNPEMSQQDVDSDVKRRWEQWVLDQGGEVKEQEQEKSPSKTVEDYGFARTPKYTFFPATRERQCDRSNMVKVVFLATGTTAFVPLKDWQVYSVEAAATLRQDKLANRCGFGAALKLLEARLCVLRGDQGVDLDTTGASFVMATLPRKLGPLNPSKLSTEKTSNDAAMRSKMFLKKNKKWGCRQCPDFQASYRPQARRHASDCGERPKLPRVRSTLERRTCSVEDCEEKFSSVSSLDTHYRTTHPDKVRPLRCIPCGKSFNHFKNLRRHRNEYHPNRVSRQTVYSCEVCQFTSIRKANLLRHMSTRHEIKVVDPDSNSITGHVSSLAGSTSSLVGSTSSQAGSTSSQAGCTSSQAGCQAVTTSSPVRSSSSLAGSSASLAESTSSLVCSTSSQAGSNSSSKAANIATPSSSGAVNTSSCHSLSNSKESGSLDFQVSELESRVDSLSAHEALKLNNICELSKMLRVSGLIECKRAMRGEVRPGKRKRRVRAVQAPFEARRSSRLHQEVQEEEGRGLEDVDLQEEELERSNELVGELILEMLGEVMEIGMDIISEVKVSKEKKCPYCSVVKRCAGNLAVHVRSMHTEGEVAHSCSKGWCDQTFPTFWEMCAHRKSCVWTCTRCGHKIVKSCRVKGHLRKCTGRQ